MRGIHPVSEQIRELSSAEIEKGTETVELIRVVWAILVSRFYEAFPI